MRRRPGQSLRIGVGLHAVSLLRTSRWFKPALTLVAEAAVDADVTLAPERAIAAALERLLADGAHANWPATIVLDDALTRLWQVTPPQGVATLADLQGATALRFQALYGDSPAGWELQADWDSGAAFFAAAVPKPLLAALTASAAGHRLAIVEVVPHFIDAWNRWHGALKTGAWFGLVHERVLTLAAVEARRLRAVRALPLPAGVDAGMLAQLVAREALLLDLAPPALLQLCGDVPAALNAVDGPVPGSTSAMRIVMLDGGRRALVMPPLASTLSPALAPTLASALASTLSPAVALACNGSPA